MLVHATQDVVAAHAGHELDAFDSADQQDAHVRRGKVRETEQGHVTFVTTPGRIAA